MVERFQKLSILTGNAHPDLSTTSKIYSFTNAVVDHQKSKLPMRQGSSKTTGSLIKLKDIVLITSF